MPDRTNPKPSQIEGVTGIRERAQHPEIRRLATEIIATQSDEFNQLEGIQFEIESVERLKWGIVERAIARRPE